MLTRSLDFTKGLTISLTKSILGLGIAEYKTLYSKDVFKDSAISFNCKGFTSVLARGLNYFFGVVTNFLVFMPRFPKSSQLKDKFFTFVL